MDKQLKYRNGQILFHSLSSIRILGLKYIFSEAFVLLSKEKKERKWEQFNPSAHLTLNV